jgi:SPP1 family predicted phage head-tail adaptor
MDQNISVNPGRLRHRITVKTRPTSQNSYGEEITDITQWNDFASFYAAISPSSGREFYAAQQINAKVSTIFIIRYYPGIKPNMKVVYGTRTFNILAASDIDERHREIHLWCEEAFLNG